LARKGYVSFINSRLIIRSVGCLSVSTNLRPLVWAALVLLLLLVAGASAATHQVSSDLQGAINSARTGDTILVSPGTYENIVITKSLNLIGDGAEIETSNRQIGIKVRADNVNISGFTVNGGFYGIHMEESDNCVISNNIVTRCEEWGIGLVFSDDNVIRDNVASFNGLGGEGWYGIYLSNSNRNQIVGNVANDNGEYGVCMFPSCNGNLIQNNVMERNDYGIYMFTDCSGNIIRSNQLTQNRNSGLKMIHNCVDNQVLNNTIYQNGVVGIFLQEGSGDNLIQGNEIVDNAGSSGVSFGIQIQGGPGNNTIVQNNISGSQKGIFVSSDGNHIYSNRIFDSVIPAEDRGVNMWYAVYPQGGNFWGDYQGQDEMSGPNQDQPGGDGFGDIPYKINEQVRDRYPIMGQSVLPLKLIEGQILPPRARIGEQVKVQATLESKYGVAQISARAYDAVKISEPSRYVPMNRVEGDTYEGVLQTALMESGRYEVVLTAKDKKGNSIEEKIGELELQPRSGWSIDTAISQST
jgi:nitrous oxidase accessory protein